jgi:predicted transposase YdaD
MDQFPYDTTLKLMAIQDPLGFLVGLHHLLHLPQGTLRLESSAVSGELPSERRYADLVWRVVTSTDTPLLLHVEFQLGESEVKMEERLLDYVVRLYLREHLPVRSVVILLNRKATIAKSPLVLAANGQEYLRFHYEVVKLWREPHEAILRLPSPLLWPLAGAMAGMNEKNLAAAAAQLASSDVEQQKKRALLEQLALLAGLQLEAEQVQRALRRFPMIEDLYKASSVTKEAYAEGEAKGRAEGAAENARRVARMSLERRFKLPLAPEIEEAIAGADEATLDSLVAEMIENSSLSLDDVRQRLGLIAF